MLSFIKRNWKLSWVKNSLNLFTKDYVKIKLIRNFDNKISVKCVKSFSCVNLDKRIPTKVFVLNEFDGFRGYVNPTPYESSMDKAFLFFWYDECHDGSKPIRKDFENDIEFEIIHGYGWAFIDLQCQHCPF